MAWVHLTSTGSDAMDASLKFAFQYFYLINKNTKRVNFISRERSYHGNTIGALSVSSFGSRTTLYDKITTKNVYFVSSCYPYRQMLEN